MDDSTHDDLADLICQILRNEGPQAVEVYIEEHPEDEEEIRSLLPSLLLLEGLALHATEQKSEESVPHRIGDFRIVREIGRGGMGVVYEALQMSLDRRVALKVLPRQTFEDEVQVERFRREARAAARLRHDHIVPVYGISSHEGLHFYVMQFIEGHGLDEVIRDLRDRHDEDDSTEKLTAALSAFYELKSDETSIGRLVAADRSAEGQRRDESTGAIRARSRADRGRRPDARTVAKLGIQVADALAHAHAEGLLHRDIKPSNLILDAEGRCWVTDFGLAKDHQADDITHSGEIVGTLRYMAPERFRGWTDPRSDIYAVGLVLYELLLLRPAFLSSERPALIREILDETPVTPRRIDSTISRDFETIVLKAIDKEPSRRYATARDLVTDLENFLAGRPLLARRSGPFVRAVKWSRRHPYPAAMVLFVLMATALFVWNRVEHARELEDKNRELEGALVEVQRTQEVAESEHLRARKFFDQLTMRLAESHADLPLAERARENILSDALLWYRDRLQERGHDPKLALETTSALQTMASIERSIGQTEEAMSHLREALSILEGREGREFRIQEARVLGDLAFLHGRGGQIEEAASCYQKALDRVDGELAVRKEDRLLVRNKAELLNNLARTLTLYDKPRALELQVESLKTLEPLVGTAALPRDRRQFGTLASNLAIDLHLLSRSQEGLDWLQRGLDVLGEAESEEIRSGGFDDTRASLHLQRALIAFESGLGFDYVADYEEARRLLDGLVERHPDRFDIRERRSQVLNNLAVVYLNRARTGSVEDDEKARQLLELALADQELLYRRAPGPELALAYARSLANAARQIAVDDASSAEELEKARAWFDRSMELLDSAAAMPDARLEKLSIASNMGIISYLRGKKEEARAILEEQRGTIDQLLDDLPGRGEAKHLVAGFLNNHAEVLIDGGAFDLAEADLQRGLELENELLERTPDAPELLLFKRNLLLTLIRVRLARGDHEGVFDAIEGVEPLVDDVGAQRLLLHQIAQASRMLERDDAISNDEKLGHQARLRTLADRVESHRH